MYVEGSNRRVTKMRIQIERVFRRIHVPHQQSLGRGTAAGYVQKGKRKVLEPGTGLKD